MKGRRIVTFMMFLALFVGLSFVAFNQQAEAQKQKQTSVQPQNQTEDYIDIDEDEGEIPLVNVDQPYFQQAEGPGNLVYVQDNLSTGSGIMIFRRENAELTLLKTIPTGGKGMFDTVGFNRAPTGIFAAVDIGPFEHDGIIMMNKERTRLFSCNQGDDTLSVFDISPDGLELTPVPGSPFKTGRIPSSVALAGPNFDIVIVVNKNDPAGNPKPAGLQGGLITYKMAANGSLSLVPNSEIKFPGARCDEGVICNQSSTPSQVLPTADGKIVFVNDFFAGMIRPFKVNPDGTLKTVPPFDLRTTNELNANKGNFPFTLGLGLHPIKNVLYTGLVFEDKVGVLRYSPKSGKLQFIRSAPNGGSTVCWFSLRKDGRYMWTSNQASNSINTYDLLDPESPIPTQLIKFQGCGEPSHVITSPPQDWIYYVNSSVTNKCSQKDPNTRSNMVHTLRIDPNNGQLTEVKQPKVFDFLPLGERIQGVASK